MTVGMTVVIEVEIVLTEKVGHAAAVVTTAAGVVGTATGTEFLTPVPEGMYEPVPMVVL